jgi:Ala-tRNA(Pro) deacylase
MSIANHVQDYMAEHGVAWETVRHQPSESSREAARLAHVRPDRIAKAVVLEDDAGYVLAVIGADHRLDVPALSEALHRDLWLASEPEISVLFPDCAPGAVPAVGPAYGISTVWEADLADQPEVYFEGGDHRTLVHMSGTEFYDLMQPARCMPWRFH